MSRSDLVFAVANPGDGNILIGWRPIPLQNSFTPFLPDALGAPASVAAGPLHFVGENKRRVEAKPSRTIIISMLAAGFLTLFAASALAVQSLVELDRSFKADLV